MVSQGHGVASGHLWTHIEFAVSILLVQIYGAYKRPGQFLDCRNTSIRTSLVLCYKYLSTYRYLVENYESKSNYLKCKMIVK